MNCIMCGSDGMHQQRRNVPYRSLRGTVLVGVKVWECAECGEQEVVIPAINELDRVLARAVANKPGRLTSDEVRFLRKHLGWSGADFAGHFGVQPETVSRWENGTEMGPQAERLLRVCVTRLEPIDDYLSLERLLNRQTEQETLTKPIRVQHRDNQWELAA
ncbi:MAG: type II toxin-antitoxin system MqsA family antitoxin [Gemmatimonadales bacterium]|jgi:putative transcriptional regulator|nr:type II toxin-antitoxin system MqsA family antitoxin [Gemmatimonadales bacterium]